MTKIKNAVDLKKLSDKERANLSLRLNSSDSERREILVCVGGSCLASGSGKVVTALKENIEKHKASDKVKVVQTGCMGPCAVGPAISIVPDGVFYQNIKAEDAEEIITSHILNNQIVERLLRKEHGDEVTPKSADIEFFKRQKKIVLDNCGLIDPLSINEYIAMDGYQGLTKALTQMTDVDICQSITESGLRGRGGGGFPTGRKWDFTRQTESSQKYVVCNADEGDPGAFMDRSILEGDPHSIIEGMAIAANAIGASQGFIYVRAEYPLAVERLNAAIDQAKRLGLLGEKILESDFNFDLEIRMGSGAFVCGEETALLTSIEGNRGEPRPRPPFPAQKGLWDEPTVLNNVETFANIPRILRKGSDWYNKIGTEKSRGTKVFALAGAIRNCGMVEVPIGISLGELIYDIGGGIKGGHEFKAAQIGGPSGGCIPKQHLGVSLDYESLTELGAIMGSGGLIVMDDNTCMVDVARFFLEFVQEESCGKCTPCRVGTKRLLEIVERICAGEGQEGDIEKLIELGNDIKETALCGLGKTAPNPVLSTIRHFRDEYEAHIRDKRCPAGVCPGLVLAPCASACPAGVDIPGFVSLVGEKRYSEALKLHRERNPFAAACARVCFHTCEEHCRRASLDSPVAIRSVKRFMVDQEVTIQLPEVKENPENATKKIAVIGAGPAGLSCAYFLARLGYKPKVFEAEPRPGGMMVQAIPAYRLPRETLAREVRMIENMGVEIETGKRLGQDFTLTELKEEDYEAVFVAVGAPDSVSLKIPGADAKGMTEALSFLREYNIRGSAPVGKNVVICGGGNAAIDAARTAVRLGSEKVTVVYRRTKEEMPAYQEEIEEAEKEGVEIRILINPSEIEITAGKISGVICRKMTLGDYDQSGRRRPEATESELIRIEADQVIAAISQRLDLKKLLGETELDVRTNGYLAINPVNCQSSIDWIFAGGDSVLGPASVVDAVGHGERAAVGIDEFITGENHAFWREDKELDTNFDPEADPVAAPREKPALLSCDRRKENFDEVEKPWAEPTAVRQASRCLRCDWGKRSHTW